ncbi:SNF2 family N-terminal domain-containing protein [Rhexocercosporidium sp. MPI-PUGE-AT-0058]|nr:SNF2 family N-terminal domain-containing protein [Rhexocercosporidium sp. MPI-PUGE-AT-0058]
MNSPYQKHNQAFVIENSFSDQLTQGRIKRARLDPGNFPTHESPGITAPGSDGNYGAFLELRDSQSPECEIRDITSDSASDLEVPNLSGPSRALTEFPTLASQILAQVTANNPEICYGALCETQALLLPNSNKLHGESILSIQEKFRTFEIVKQDDYHGVLSTGIGVFARLDSVTSIALRMLEKCVSCTVKAVIDTNVLNQATSSTDLKGIFILSINVFGLEDEADNVGEALASGSTFLQHPCFLEDGIQYYNPQYFYPDNKKSYLTDLIGLSDSDIRAKSLSDEVEGVLASLEDVPLLNTDTNVGIPDGILTPLKQHQTIALAFIRQHEDHHQCQSRAAELRRLIGISTLDQIPSYAVGGILADVMGLGKTLSILSAILSSKLASAMYQKAIESKVLSGMTSAPILVSRATLVIVTSIQVLDGWKREIATHLHDGALNYVVFHGDGRPKLPQKIVEHDIVLTTYATLVADCKGARILQKIAWFRVVLDEAHWIRNQSSQQFLACEGLSAQRRWCLTGTPIQNRLDDLLSLLKFLHCEPFSRRPVFQQYILDPLSKDNLKRVKTLHVLLRGICLRRDQRYLQLPEPCYQEVKISLSKDEKKRYDEVLIRMQDDLDNIVSNQSKRRKYAILFTMVMKLRRLCNHGTMIQVEQLPLGAFPESDSDSVCEYCQGSQQENLAMLNKNQACPECGRMVFPAPSNPTSFALPIPLNSLVGKDAVQHGAFSSPVFSPGPASKQPSTKLAAVLENLKLEPPGSKSLVFSYWTLTLDLLETLLARNNIRSVRIDGRVGYEQRLAALESFRNDPEVSVLLMSIQTGSVGLNLALANRVHIIEPQWNPSVEEQAIARALRMGQTRTVTVIRYSMQATIEQNIQNMQRRKRSLAKFTLDGANSDSGSLEDLKFMLNLK